MKKLFLPLGLLLALLCALTLPAPGSYLAGHGGITLLICIIFLVSGFQTDTNGVKFDRKLLLLFSTAAVISLLIGPVLGVTLTKIFRLAPALGAGLIIISSMPPTISSGIVITGLARGNTLLALFLTITLNLLAIVTIPFTLSIFLKATGSVPVDRAELLTTMLLLVLLPFALGKLIRTFLKTTSVSDNWNFVNSGCVILVVYGSLALSGNELTSMDAGEYVTTSLLVTGIHLLLFALSAGAGKLLQIPTQDVTALAFVTSQKTLAMALAVMTGIRLDTGKAVIVCLLFHFLQLLADSFLAARWHRISPES